MRARAIMSNTTGKYAIGRLKALAVKVDSPRVRRAPDPGDDLLLAP
jgi:hypothetical protein